MGVRWESDESDGNPTESDESDVLDLDYVICHMVSRDLSLVKYRHTLICWIIGCDLTCRDIALMISV